MKKIIKTISFFAIFFFMIAGHALGVEFGDGGVSLQNALDSITVSPPGDSNIDVTTDEIPDFEDSFWSTGSSGALFVMVFKFSELSPNITEFGIFDACDPSKRVRLFDGSAGTADMTTLIFLQDGTVRVNFVDTSVKFTGNSFGFYINSSNDQGGGIWYSDTSLNSDGMDHMAAYYCAGDVIQIPGLQSGSCSENHVFFAFEDSAAGTANRDYDDMIILVENILVSEPCEQETGGCRFTGGGVDEFIVDNVLYYEWDHEILESDEMVTASGIDRYTFGGQAGANTALPPQPKGEWEHNQHSGPSGSFAFHGGTSSAPAGTEIVEIRCMDPGFCFPARPAPAKQLDFDGIGTFSTIGKGKSAPKWRIENATVAVEGNVKRGFSGTYHWFEVNIDDLGEPGAKNGCDEIGTCPEQCPDIGFGEKGVDIPANCDCPDFYRITIYDGVPAAAVVWLDENNIDPNSLNRTDIIYEVYGYPKGGNLQIHPLTGYDLK